MLGLFAAPNDPSIFRQNSVILHPKRTRQDTKTISMWGFCGGVLPKTRLENPLNQAKRSSFDHENISKTHEIRLKIWKETSC
jgi:hypothetical protein